MSKKIRIITDSNSGITKEEAGKYGITVLPMPFIIDGKTYFENITLTQDQFYEMMENDADISTSQPAIPDITNLWDKVLEDCDEIVHIPMSSGLSGSTATASALARDYDGRVQVVDNQRISVTQLQSAIDAVHLAGKGFDAAQIKEILETVKFDSSIYIKLETLKYLKKGGRITPAAAAIGSALRLKPVLQIQGEKLDAYTIARTGKQAESKMLLAMDHDIETRFGTLNNVWNINFAVAHTKNPEAAEEFKDLIKKRYGIDNVRVAPLSLSIASHVGPGTLAIAVSMDVDYAYQQHQKIAESVG